MIRLTDNGLTRSGIGEDGQPFTVSMLDSVRFFALGAIMDAQNNAAYVNTQAAAAYNNALSTYNQNQGSIATPPHKPQMQVVPDYPGKDGQPIIQWVDFVPPLADPAPPIRVTPSTPIVDTAAHNSLSPFEAAVIATLTAIAKKLGV